jgi:uncharacterized protein (DUF1778 family)
MANSDKKPKESNRFDMRLTEELKRRVEHAAELRGATVSSYVKTVLSQAADMDIQNHKLANLTLADREAFAQAIINPPDPSAKSVQAAKRYKDLFGL